MAVLRVFSFGNDLWDPSYRFETSWLLPPYAFFALRALFSLYCFVVRFFVIGWDCTHGNCGDEALELSYFTVLTHWGLACYFFAAALHTLTYARAGRPLLDRLPRPLQALHSLLFSTVAVYPFIVTAVYWALLYAGAWFPDRYDAWSNVSAHALNSLFALAEVLLARAPPMPWIHLLWLLVILALYLAVCYVRFAADGSTPYDFLDPNATRPGVIAGYVLGIAVGCCVVFAVVWGMIWVRRWLTEEKLGMDGKFARQRTRADDVEMGALKT